MIWNIGSMVAVVVVAWSSSSLSRRRTRAFWSRKDVALEWREVPSPRTLIPPALSPLMLLGKSRWRDWLNVDDDDKELAACWVPPPPPLLSPVQKDQCSLCWSVDTVPDAKYTTTHVTMTAQYFNRSFSRTTQRWALRVRNSTNSLCLKKDKFLLLLSFHLLALNAVFTWRW